MAEAMEKAVYYLHVVYAAKLHPQTQSKLLYVNVEIDDFTAHTAQTGSPIWNEVLKFTSLLSSTLFLHLKHDTSLGPKVLGTVEILISKLLDLGQERQDVILPLATVGATGESQDGGEIIVRLRREGPTDGTAARAGVSATGAMEAVVSRLQLLAEVADENAKIYPCANLVWRMSSSVYKFVKEQLDSDPQIIDLISSMENVYSFTDQLHANSDKLGFINNTIIATIRQTFECLIFLQEYAGRGFAKRALKETFPSDATNRIQRFTKKFAQLSHDLDTDIDKQRDFVSFRMIEQTDYIEMEQTLHKLQPMTMQPYGRPECLPGTRTSHLKFIAEWATSPLNQRRNMLWVCGVTGSGKSTLSTTIASFFQKMHRLGAHIFFSRSMAKRNTPSFVIRTLAHQLGSFDHRIGHAIAAAIHDWPDSMCYSTRLQFQRLLIEPLASLNMLEFEGPIVVVLDALDECGSAEDRSDLLQVLAEDSANLPSVLRFVVTSRPEYDIRNYFESQTHILAHHLDITSDDTQRDIEAFLRYQLGQMLPQWRDLPKIWARDHIIRALVQRAGGLFVWASNACKFIHTFDPEERLRVVVGDSDISSDAAAALDTMYITALESAGVLQDANCSDDFRAVMGTILVTRGPLSAAGLNGLLCLDGHATSRLGSVLYGDAVIRILHPSFADFLTSRARCKYDAWFIDPKSQDLRVAIHCLDRLDGYLRHDVCNLGLVSDAHAALPEDIIYACCFWVEHVCSINDPLSITDKLEAFLFKNLLHWLEVMSILKRSRETIRLLENLRDWHNTPELDNSHLQNFIGDACQFTQIFVSSIEEHPLHVYANALPSLGGIWDTSDDQVKHSRRHLNSMTDNHQLENSVSRSNNPQHPIDEKNLDDQYQTFLGVETSSSSASQPPNKLSLIPPKTQRAPSVSSFGAHAEFSASGKRRLPLSTAKATDSSPKLTTQPMYPDPFFRHWTVLPTMDMTLYEALVAGLPSCSSPLDYAHAEASYANDVVQELWTLTKKDDIHYASFAGDGMIYRRLIVYIFAHLMLCTSKKGLLSQFKETIQQWKTWDTVTIMQNHQVVRDHLRDLFQRGLQSNPSVHADEAFRNIVAVDTIGLSSRLMIMVTDNNKYKEVLAQRGPIAQSLLDLLQARLDYPMDSQHKSRHVKALLKLSRASGLYPKCFVLQGVEMEPRPVAQGGYGDVYEGQLHGQKIAVKALRMYKTSDLVKLLKEFSSEAVLWRQLSHANVLPFYGIYHLDETMTRVCLTSPWMDNGHVAEFVNRNPDTYCVHLALDVALGLEYLHTLKPCIVHGDLKGANVLITRSGRASLADFGLASAIDSKTIAMTHNSSTKAGGTVRWQAPELHNPQGYQRNSKATDIYAFACVCYEMFSGEIPFYDDTYDVRVVLGLMQGKRPARPTNDLSMVRGLSDEMWGLIKSCWTQEPTHRPTATQVVECLRLLPNQPVDKRPINEFIPHKRLHNDTDHPFSPLAAFGHSRLAS